MDLGRLADFLDLARTGRFSESARNRCISQPALTRRIQQLEEWAGARLFERSSSPLRLTPAGEALRPLAASVVVELQAYRGRNLCKAGRATRCMSLHSLGSAYLPDEPMELSFGTYDQCFAALRSRDVDVALLYHCDAVRDERFAALSRKSLGHEVFIPAKTGTAPARVVELTRENYLGRALSPAFDDCKRRLGYAAGPVAARFDAVRALVEAGRGVGWLPERLAGDLQVLEDPGLKVQLDVVLVSRRARRASVQPPA